MATQETDILLNINLDQAKKDLADLTKQIQDLNNSSESNEEDIKKLERQWDLLNATIKKVEGTTKEYGKETKAANSSSESLGNTTKKNNGIFTSSVSAFKAAGGGIKGLTAAAKAFIATPIGAAITAITSALAIFKKALSGSENGQKALAKATAVVKGAFDSLLQVVRSVGGLLIDFFKGDWTKLGKDLDDVKDAVKGIGGNIAENAQIAEREVELRKRESELGVQIAKNEAEIAKLRRVAMDQSAKSAEREAAIAKMTELEKQNINEQIALAKDQLKLLQDKHSLTDSSAEDIEEERAKEAEIYGLQAQLETTLQKTDRLQDNIAKSVAKQKDDTKELNKEAKEYVDHSKEIKALATSVASDMAAAELEALKLEAKTIDDLEALKQKELEISEKEEAIEKENLKRKYDERLVMAEQYGMSEAEITEWWEQEKTNIEEKYAQKRNEIQQKSTKATTKATLKDYANYGKAMTSMLNGLNDALDDGSKQAFERKKVGRIAEATISGIEGAIQAYNSFAGMGPAGPALGAAAAAVVTATTVAGINKIRNEQYQSSGGDSSIDASSRQIQASQSALTTGTTSVNEAIISRNISQAATQTTPTVQTVLVVDDVTSKQMQQDHIQRVSTI